MTQYSLDYIARVGKLLASRGITFNSLGELLEYLDNYQDTTK